MHLAPRRKLRRLPKSFPIGTTYVVEGHVVEGHGDEAGGRFQVFSRYVVLPGGQPHFHWAKSGEYITQVSAIGPLGLEYFDPADDPRGNGNAG